MASIAAADVKKLRDMTGAGMMDAKRALTEAEGDFEKAIELLRVRGAAKAARRGAERQATAGLVAAERGALVELNSETDFVAKNEQFNAVAQKLAEHAAAVKPADRDEFLASELDGRTVEQTVADLAVVIGEKIELGRVASFEGTVETYLHRRASDLPPAVGVVVEYSGDDAGVARDVALQIAAMRAQYVTREDIPAEIVAKEREIAEATAREEGKPEGALPRIVEGRVNGFFKDVVLLEQVSVKDNKLTVRAQLEAAGVTVTRFARFEVGAA
ncbi:MAG: translation elongation factor Ts [Actinomycetota bacterium]|nr:translation elongation factor Ts [Actinomycetota bacterium]